MDTKTRSTIAVCVVLALCGLLNALVGLNADSSGATMFGLLLAAACAGGVVFFWVRSGSEPRHRLASGRPRSGPARAKRRESVTTAGRH